MTTSVPETDARFRLLRVLAETGREAAAVTVKGDAWTVLVRQDLYHLVIVHEGDARYMQVVFPARFTDEATLSRIDSALKNPLERAVFDYQLKRIISTPASSFRLHVTENRFAGFDTMARIYPLDADFSPSRLETAIQGVISAGITGIAFLATITDGKDLEQQLGDYFARASPDGMYG